MGLPLVVALIALLCLVVPSGGPRRALEDHVEFTSVQPDNAAPRAVVDCHALPVRHFEFNFARWTIHSGFFLVSEFPGCAAKSGRSGPAGHRSRASPRRPR